MPYCHSCGSEVRENQDVCLSCGVRLNNTKKAVIEEGSTTGYAVLGFFIPLIGLILYLIWQSERPKAAKSAGKGALIGFVVNIVFTVIFMIIYVSFISEFFEYI